MRYFKKKIYGILSVVMAVAMLSPVLTVFADSKDWGLGFPTPGAKPTGNEQADYLKEFDAYFVGTGEEKVIYLTFDAGYENGYTETILNTLKEKSVPAAFFLVGTYIRDQEDLIKRMVQEGHIVGNHTMKHPDMSAITDKTAFAKEFSQTEELYKSITSLDMPKFYRPPSGKYNEKNLEMTRDLGYKTIFWSMAYADWDVKKQPSHEEAFKKLMSRLHPGAVLLLHSTSKTNSEILGELIDRYRELGYEFKSLNDLK